MPKDRCVGANMTWEEPKIIDLEIAILGDCQSPGINCLYPGNAYT